MIPDRDEPILDACLEEVLRELTPPDLTQRILQAWTGAAGSEALRRHTPPPLVPVPSPPAAVATPLPLVLNCSRQALADAAKDPLMHGNSTVTRTGLERFFSPSRRTLALGACALGLLLAIGAAAMFSLKQGQLARASAGPPGESPSSLATTQPVEVVHLPPLAPQPEPANLAISLPPLVIPEIETPATLPNASDPSSARPSTSKATVSAAPIGREKGNLPRSPDAGVISFVNAELARSWQESGVKPASQASDAEWCQRLFVRVLGRSPTADELKSFVDDKASDRREKLVDRLLTESTYAEAFARKWSRVWTQALLGRASGGGDSLTRREELEGYLRAAISADKPFDAVAEELLTASGSAVPGSDDYNPAVSFLLDSLDSSATVPTARVARVLLGHQLQCAQCHAHPTRGWSQEQFWALNAFFRQMRAERRDDGMHLLNVDFRGQGRGVDGEVFYETPDGLVKAAFPQFIDGTEIPKSGNLAVVDRRRELARLVAQSDDLAKAVVNRVWAQFFDYGFTRPIDDLDPSSSLPAARALDRLANEFAARDYSLKALIRWTVLSEAFLRSSKMTDLASKDMPEEGELALFSRYYARPTPIADVHGSLVQAARIRKLSPTEGERAKARLDWLEQFSRGPARGRAKAVVTAESALMVKSGDPSRLTSSGDPSGVVKKMVTSPMPFDKKVEHLFLAALARQPAPRERQAAQQVLASSGNNPAAALEDIWWSLLNCNECVFDR